jgi:dihydroxyacetone kinase-like protein
LPDGEDIGALIKTTGMTLARKAPSTFGALLGGAFMRAATEFEGASELTGEGVARLMASLLTAVCERGGAAPGQRTMVDALDGGANAAADAVAAGGAVEVLAAAARGASEAADATADMDAQFGRAAWVSERAKGHKDAGAVAWATYLEALSDAVANKPATI